MKFLYTNNPETVKELTQQGYPLLKKLDNGTHVFANISEDNLKFNKFSDILPLDKITF